MASHTEADIREAVKSIKELSDDTLVHYFKIISSKHTAKEKKLYDPLQKAIEKERRRRGLTTTISAIAKPKTVKKKDLGANPDDY